MQDKTWSLMEKHLEQDTYQIVSAQSNAPSVEKLSAIGAALGCAFPEQFIVHASGQYGGLYVAVKEDIWPRAKEFDVGPFWTFLYGFCTFNTAEGIPEFMDIQIITENFRNDTSLDLVPFMKLFGDASRYCFDAKGDIHLWDHGTNEAEPVEKSFFELLDYQLGELKQRKEKMLERRKKNS
jgi:hypothetical protein